MQEILAGVYRIETELGGNRLGLHLLRGERTLLIDSGVRTTPAEVIFPVLAEAGLPDQIDLLLISHADADHHGGNAQIQAHSPQVIILCHELDRPRIESKAQHLQGRYDQVVAADDVDYEPELMNWLSDMIGPDTSVHLSLQGGETLGLGDGSRWQVWHTPGHTAGHLSLWHPAQRILIIQDAVLWRGVPDSQGAIPSPPPYYELSGYRESIQRLQALEAEVLLAAHYPVMRGPEIGEFFTTSLAFVDRLDGVVLEVVQSGRQPLTLSAIIAAVDERLGPFAVRVQWIGPVLAHLNRHVAGGRLQVLAVESGRAWATP